MRFKIKRKEALIPMGALPPNPRHLSQLRQNGLVWNKEEGFVLRGGLRPHAPAEQPSRGRWRRSTRPIPAPESTLGSLPSVALSSAQVLIVYANLLPLALKKTCPGAGRQGITTVVLGWFRWPVFRCP
jgi:hypothetical protein